MLRTGLAEEGGAARALVRNKSDADLAAEQETRIWRSNPDGRVDPGAARPDCRPRGPCRARCPGVRTPMVTSGPLMSKAEQLLPCSTPAATSTRGPWQMAAMGLACVELARSQAPAGSGGYIPGRVRRARPGRHSRPCSGGKSCFGVKLCPRFSALWSGRLQIMDGSRTKSPRSCPGRTLPRHSQAWSAPEKAP